VRFSPSPPGIDVSACAGRNLTWSSQAVSPDPAGNINAVWAPNEPNTMRVVGTVSATVFQAALRCVGGCSAGGRIHAVGSDGTPMLTAGEDGHLRVLRGPPLEVSRDVALGAPLRALVLLPGRAVVAGDQGTLVDVELATGKVAVRSEADTAAVTRKAAGEGVAGSRWDATQARDRWTFRRDIASRDPNWLLVETDEEE
jgi:hypothetical protein